MRPFIYIIFTCLCSGSCSSVSTNGIELIPAENFTTQIDGHDVSLYTIYNSVGTTMQVTNYGGRVVSLWTADRSGKMGDIVLGYDSIDKYINNKGARFLGAVIGRYANRIANGEFKLNGESYQLSTYSNGHCLHGGERGFDRVVWSVDSVATDAIYLSYLSKDMEEGFPGNLTINMKYQITNKNEFRIEYKATTDKSTPINLTHHSFFNLKGEGCGTIDNHILMIAADKYTPVTCDLIPMCGNESVKNTPFDFREPHQIADGLQVENEQLNNCSGYDHNFVLSRKEGDDIVFAASVEEPTTGRYMEVLTSEPGLQFYTGNFLNGKAIGKGGKSYERRGSLSLETQHFPDSPNHQEFPSTILNPSEIYTHICIYRFSTR